MTNETKWVDEDGIELKEKNGNDLNDEEFYVELLRWTKSKKIIEENSEYIYTKYILKNGFIEHYIQLKPGASIENHACAKLYCSLLAKKKINEGITRYLLNIIIKNLNISLKVVYLLRLHKFSQMFI